MIPREILKKIQQSKITRNRVVTWFSDGGLVQPSRRGRLAGFSFQPTAQLDRITASVPNGNHFDFAMLLVNGEINRVRPRLWHSSLSCQPRRKSKSFRISSQRSQKPSELVVELQTNAPFALFIPINALIPLQLGLAVGNDFESHFLARRRFLISTETSSIAVPRPGFLSASSARRSSSVICSGVNSSSNSPRIRRKTSRCSPNGSLRNCSTNSVAVMLSSLTAADLFASS